MTVLGRRAGEEEGGQRISIGHSSLEAIHVFALAQVRQEGNRCWYAGRFWW